MQDPLLDYPIQSALGITEKPPHDFSVHLANFMTSLTTPPSNYLQRWKLHWIPLYLRYHQFGAYTIVLNNVTIINSCSIQENVNSLDQVHLTIRLKGAPGLSEEVLYLSVCQDPLFRRLNVSSIDDSFALERLVGFIDANSSSTFLNQAFLLDKSSLQHLCVQMLMTCYHGLT